MTLCVYALTTRQVAGPRSRGLEREPLQLVTVGRVSAVVGDLHRVPSATHEQLTRYDAVVRRLWERYAAVLPARFATCVDREELDFIVRSRHDVLRRALRAVRGRAQMTIRIVDTDRRPVVARGKGSGARRTGTEYLQQRASMSTVPAVAPIRAAVRRWVRDERIEQRDRIVTVYHLIPRSAVVAYQRAFVALTEQLGVRAIVSGPFPPYAFTVL